MSPSFAWTLVVAKPVLVTLVSALLSGCAAPSGDGGGTTNDDAVVITDPNDTAYLLNASDDRKHIHDYWAGATEIILLDEDQDTGTGSGAEWGGSVNMPDGKTIIPGTGWVNTTLTWNDPEIHMRLEYTAADGTTGAFPVVSGALLSIISNETMNDPPHIQVSHWSFMLRMNSDNPLGDMDGTAMHVLMVAVRAPGDIPFAPSHPDLWQGQTQLVRADESADMTAAYVPVTGTGNTPRIADLKPIPAGTTRLLLQLHYNSSTPEPIQATYTLSWRGADHSEYEARGVQPNRTTANGGHTFLEWELDVEARMCDSPYATESYWELSISPFERPVFAMQGDYHITVTAFRGTYSPRSAQSPPSRAASHGTRLNRHRRQHPRPAGTRHGVLGEGRGDAHGA